MMLACLEFVSISVEMEDRIEGNSGTTREKLFRDFIDPLIRSLVGVVGTLISCEHLEDLERSSCTNEGSVMTDNPSVDF
jgi:hypothetical protein